MRDWGDGDTFDQIAERHGFTNDEVRRTIIAAQLERKATAAADVATVDDGAAEGARRSRAGSSPASSLPWAPRTCRCGCVVTVPRGTVRRT